MTTGDDDSDESLVRRFQRGDVAAFEVFVARHQDRIYRTCGVLLRSSDRAADAAQDVFLRAYTGLGRFRFGAQPFTWLYATAKNVCKEYNRREPVNEDEWDERSEAANSPPHGGRSPVEAASDSERRLRAARALVAELPPRQRDVVVLRIFEELSTNETAAVMRCRPGTVKAQLHKALARLRRELEPGGAMDEAYDEA